MKPFRILLLISMLLPIAANAQIAVGDTAVAFSYDTLAGSSIGAAVSLNDYSGKVVYIFFYGAGCPHCITNGPVTESQIYGSFKDDTNFVALGLDTWDLTPSANASFRSSTGISYTLLLNARQSLVDYYGNSNSYDRSVVIGGDGLLKYKGTGYVNTDYEQVIEVIQTQLDALMVSTEADPDQPGSIQLHQNYPNPFNPSTEIRYQLAVNSRVELKVFDMLGREVSTLFEGNKAPGSYSATFNADELNSGIYFYRLTSNDQVITKKMMLIK